MRRRRLALISIVLLIAPLGCGENSSEDFCQGRIPQCDCGFGVIGTPECDPSGYFVCGCPPPVEPTNPDAGPSAPGPSDPGPFDPGPSDSGPSDPEPTNPPPTCLDVIEGPLPFELGPPAEPMEGMSEQQTERAGNLELMCTERTVHVERDMGAIVALGDAYASLQPGLVVNAESARLGVVQPLSIPRAPVRLAIDLPLSTPSRVVEAPSSATLAEAVANLKREADAMLGTLPELPARIDLHVYEAYNFEQALKSMGISAHYNDPFVDAGFSTSLSNRRSARETSVVMRLFQPMYTISVAEDEIFQNRDFFRAGIDWTLGSPACEVLAQATEPPAYVRSVTYGRVIYYAMTSEDFHSSEDFAAALRLSLNGVVSSGRVEGSFASSYRQIVERSQVRVVIYGGSQDDAFSALREGNFTGFLQPSQAITAAPLAYRAHYLSRARPLLTLREATSYRERCCTPTNCSPPPTEPRQFDSWQVNTGWHVSGESGRAYATVGRQCNPGRVRGHVHGARVDGNGHCWGEWVTPDPRDCRAVLRYSRQGFSHLTCHWTMFEIETLIHPDPLCRSPGCTGAGDDD